MYLEGEVDRKWEGVINMMELTNTEKEITMQRKSQTHVQYNTSPEVIFISQEALSQLARYVE